jgi:hypothetical protein
MILTIVSWAYAIALAVGVVFGTRYLVRESRVAWREWRAEA